MTSRRRIKIGVGLQSVRKPIYASEPDFVAQVNRQVKVLEDTLIDIFKQVEDVSEDIILDALEPNFKA